MLVFEFKLKGKEDQYRKIDEAIRTGQFIRNACLKYWQENKGTTQNDLRKYCAILAANPDFPWAGKLNSQARQSHADRTLCAIKRFYENCKNKIPGKKGYPRFKKNSRSVEYKTTGWKLSEDRKRLTLKDGFKAGLFKLLGSRDLHFYQIKQIKQVRIIKRADGYSAQFVIDAERNEKTEYTGNQVGIDVGLASFYTDSNGHKVDNPCAIAPRFANAFYENLKDNSSAYRSGCLDDIAILERERKARRCLKPTILDRDENAALNILMKALESLENTAGQTEINAQGQLDLYLVGSDLLSKSSGKTLS